MIGVPLDVAAASLLATPVRAGITGASCRNDEGVLVMTNCVI